MRRSLITVAVRSQCFYRLLEPALRGYRREVEISAGHGRALEIRMRIGRFAALGNLIWLNKEHHRRLLGGDPHAATWR